MKNNAFVSESVRSSSQTMVLGTLASFCLQVMKEGIYEHHPWVTDDVERINQNHPWDTDDERENR